MLRHRPGSISWAAPSVVFKAPEDSSAMSTARDGARRLLLPLVSRTEAQHK